MHIVIAKIKLFFRKTNLKNKKIKKGGISLFLPRTYIYINQLTYGNGYMVAAFSGDTISPVNVACPPSLE